MKLRKLVDLAGAIDKLYKRTYKNARQTAGIARRLNSVKERFAEFEEIRNNFLVERSPNGEAIMKKDDPALYQEAQEFMKSLLDDEVELVAGKEMIDYEDLDKLKEPLTAEEINALLTLGLLKDGE